MKIIQLNTLRVYDFYCFKKQVGVSIINGLKDNDLPLQIVKKFQGEKDTEKLLLQDENMENNATNPNESFNV